MIWPLTRRHILGHHTGQRALAIPALALLLVAAALVTMISRPAIARIEYDAHTLLLKTPDQVAELIRKRVLAAQKVLAQSPGDEMDEQGVAQLRDALRIALSRPGQDGSRSNHFSRVRRDLSDVGQFEEVARQLTLEAVESLRKNQGPPRHLMTYVVMLENLMAEIRPEIETNDQLKRLVESIRDAKIVVGEQVRKQARIRSMDQLVSPSETAKRILAPGEKKPQKK
jgi:hypothetical protein